MIENSLFTFIIIKVINLWYKRPWVRGNDEIDQILKKEKKQRRYNLEENNFLDELQQVRMSPFFSLLYHLISSL